MTSTTEVSFTQDMPITAWPQGSGIPLHAYGNVTKCQLATIRPASPNGGAQAGLVVTLGAPNRPAPWYDTETGHLMSVRQLLDVALTHRDVLAEGAVVLEGEDPLLQATFASALLQVCRESGFHTEMVTSGADSDRVNDRMLREIDLITVSLPAQPDWMGGDGHGAVRLVGRLQQLGCQMRLQMPVLNGQDLEPHMVTTLADALSKLTGLTSVEIYDCEDPAAIPPNGPCRRHLPPVQQPSAALLRLKRTLLAAGLSIEETSAQI